MGLLVSLRCLLLLLLASTSLVLGLGSTCTTPLGKGTAGTNDPFWMESIKHQGISPHNPNPSTYKVFRNVKDYGAVGNGVHDDTAAINAAISDQNRCGASCQSSTVSPAVIYFPKGTYLVSTPIIPYYYSQLIGDARHPPTLLAAANFSGMAVIDADPYVPGGGGSQYWTNQNNFHRSVRNFVIDVRQVPATNSQGTGLHWQVAQATSLMNIVVQMSTASNTAHQAIWMENGSGGYMGDMVFNGGKFGIWGGNQQFTVKNVTINNAQTAIYSSWNWGWTYQGLTINNCQIGFQMATGGVTSGGQTTGAQAFIDAVVTNTPIFIQTTAASNGHLDGSIVLNNVKLTNVPIAVGVANGATVLNGGTTTIASWCQGNVYKGSSGTGTFTQGNIPAPNKPSTLLDSSGHIVARTHPQYADYSVSQFVSVRDQGAKGDGVTDDTAALNNIFAKYSGCKIIFFDAGHYIVTSTVTIPAGTQMVGEAWTVLSGKGSYFQDQTNPKPVFKVGDTGSQGIMEISDFVFNTVGPAGGAIVLEWNVKQPSGQQAGAGMWDSHVRIGGAAGTNQEISNCPQNGSGGSNCLTSFLGIHFTTQSTAYLESTWVWLSDHELDGSGQGQLTAFSGRGILSESQGPVWLIGTGSEHHVLYQYNLANAANHYMGLIQTESPYFQPSPTPPSPFSVNSNFHDPSPFSGTPSAWALHVTNSQNILVFGAGLYSFFTGYSQTCINNRNCQAQIVNIDSASTINIYSLSTVGSTYQLSISGAGVIDQSKNLDGFASTVTSWSRS